MKEYTNSTDKLEQLATYAADTPDGPRKAIPGGSVGSDDYTKGTIEYQTLPAAWWNWVISKLTENEGKTAAWLTNLYPEFEAILTAANITPDATINNQVLTAIQTLYTNADTTLSNTITDDYRKYVGGHLGSIVGTPESPAPYRGTSPTEYSEAWVRHAMVAGAAWPSGRDPYLGMPSNPQRYIDPARIYESEGWIRQAKDADLQTQINAITGGTTVGGKFIGSVTRREQVPIYSSEIPSIWGAAISLLINDWTVVASDLFYQNSSSVYIYNQYNQPPTYPFTAIDTGGWQFKYSDWATTDLPNRHLMRFEIRITDPDGTPSMNTSFNLLHSVGDRNVEIRHEANGSQSVRIVAIENRGQATEAVLAVFWDRQYIDHPSGDFDSRGYNTKYWPLQDDGTRSLLISLFNENLSTYWVSNNISQTQVDAWSVVETTTGLPNAFRIDWWSQAAPAGCCFWYPQIQWVYAYSTGAGNIRHQDLSGRDLPDQHPISAITGLDRLKYLAFTYVVDSNEALAAWANNEPGNDYTSVLIRKGIWTYDGNIVLNRSSPVTLVTAYVEGEAGSQLNITGYLGYSSAWSASSLGGMRNVTLLINRTLTVDPSQSAAYATGFYRCKKLYNCQVLMTVNVVFTSSDSTGYQAGIHGFQECQDIVSCISNVRVPSATTSGTNCQIYTEGYYNCESLTNCSADVYLAVTVAILLVGTGFTTSNYLLNCTAYVETQAVLSTGQVYVASFAYDRCNQLTNCQGTGRGYLSTSTSPITATLYSIGFYDCENLVSCIGKGNNAGAISTGTQINAGFSNCRRLTSCIGSAYSTNPRYGFWQCNYVSFCYADYRSISFQSCRIGFGNRGTVAADFSSCYVSVSGTTTAWADTAAGGYNAIY